MANFTYDQLNNMMAGLERGGLPSPAADADNASTLKFVVDFAKIKQAQPGLATGDTFDLVALPANVYVTEVLCTVTTAATGAGAKSIVLGDHQDNDRYMTTTDIKTAGAKAVTAATPRLSETGTVALRLTYTKATPATADDGTVVIAVRTVDLSDEWDGFNSGGV